MLVVAHALVGLYPSPLAWTCPVAVTVVTSDSIATLRPDTVPLI